MSKILHFKNFRVNLVIFLNEKTRVGVYELIKIITTNSILNTNFVFKVVKYFAQKQR